MFLDGESMIHIGQQVPRLVSGRRITAFVRVNEYVLIPWRLCAVVFHLAAIICVADYRSTLITTASLRPGYSQEDFDHFMISANAAVGLTVACVILCSTGLFTGRTLRMAGMNFCHCVCHSVGACLLIVVWHYTLHVTRLWHVFFFFSIPPTILELTGFCFSVWKGYDSW